jgi:hypothetical protein
VAKKRTALSGLNDTLFQGIDPYAREQGQPPESVAQLPLAEILPDPAQPRQLITQTLLRKLAGGELPPGQVLQEWMQVAASEGAASLSRVKELQQLATSIAQHGLINPITVRLPKPGETLPPGVNYLIVTGERRYWAYVYLRNEGREIREGEAAYDPGMIKASIAGEGISIRAHQLLENLMREDINALEKALGIRALRYELSNVNDSSPLSEDVRSAENAEASDAKRLVPWRMVEEALGISKRYRIFIMSVLNLTGEAQAIVAANDLAEMTIRPITQKLRDYPELQVQALRQVAAWQEADQTDDGPGRRVVASTQALVEQLLAQEAGRGPGSSDDATIAVNVQQAVQADKLRRKTKSVLRFFSNMEEQEQAALKQELSADNNAALIKELVELRDRLDAILSDVTLVNCEL